MISENKEISDILNNILHNVHVNYSESGQAKVLEQLKLIHRQGNIDLSNISIDLQKLNTIIIYIY